jgi:hypothetical protein
MSRLCKLDPRKLLCVPVLGYRHAPVNAIAENLFQGPRHPAGSLSDRDNENAPVDREIEAPILALGTNTQDIAVELQAAMDDLCRIGSFQRSMDNRI